MKNCFKKDCSNCPEPDFSECEEIQKKILSEMNQITQVDLDRVFGQDRT